MSKAQHRTARPLLAQRARSKPRSNTCDTTRHARRSSARVTGARSRTGRAAVRAHETDAVAAARRSRVNEAAASGQRKVRAARHHAAASLEPFRPARCGCSPTSTCFPRRAHQYGLHRLSLLAVRRHSHERRLHRPHRHRHHVSSRTQARSRALSTPSPLLGRRLRPTRRLTRTSLPRNNQRAHRGTAAALEDAASIEGYLQTLALISMFRLSSSGPMARMQRLDERRASGRAPRAQQPYSLDVSCDSRREQSSHKERAWLQTSARCCTREVTLSWSVQRRCGPV